MKLVLGTVLCLALCAVPLKSENNRLKEVFAWKFVDYAWDKSEDRDAAIASGEFVPENNLPLGLEVWKDKLFITIPRWKNGVVSTLNYVKITDPDTLDSDDETNTPGPTEPPTPTTAPPSTYPITPPPSTDLTTPPPPTDPTTSPPPTTDNPTTSPPPTTDYPTTSPPPTTDYPTSPTDPTTSPTNNNEDVTPLPTASILPMPARSFGETVERYKRALGENDGLTENIFYNSSKSKRKHKKRGKHEKDVGDKEDEKDKKEKKNKNEKDKSKKKKKKKCKPKPKPTTLPPSPPTPETTTVMIEATSETETTAPPPRSPPLIPYPSFAANRVAPDVNKKADESAPIVSVFRVWADACDRLWVMDTGVADILGKTTVVLKPRILIYNLNNDELIKTYEFKDFDSEEHSFFANIIVDTDPENCDKAFAYVPDLGGYGIVSYDFAKDQTRRIKHNYFHFDPLAGNMEVGGVNFQWTDGVFSVALSKRNDDGYRTAYFHCLASTKEFSVSTKVLQSKDDSTSSYYDYKLVGDRGDKSQSSASFIHENTGIMFYTQLQKDSVNCWNTNKPMSPENLVEVASDNETMIFTNDLKVDREGNLWVLTDKLPVFIYKGLDDSEVNYRIFTATVDEAVAGTNCAP